MRSSKSSQARSKNRNSNSARHKKSSKESLDTHFKQTKLKLKKNYSKISRNMFTSKNNDSYPNNTLATCNLIHKMQKNSISICKNSGKIKMIKNLTTNNSNAKLKDIHKNEEKKDHNDTKLKKIYQISNNFNSVRYNFSLSNILTHQKLKSKRSHKNIQLHDQ